MDAADDAKFGAMRHGIIRVVSSHPGVSFGVLCNRLRSFKPENIKIELEAMALDGVIDVTASRHPKNGAMIFSYIMATPAGSITP